MNWINKLICLFRGCKPENDGEPYQGRDYDHYAKKCARCGGWIEGENK